MIRLIRAELRRLTARRMTLITALLLLVAIGLYQLVVNAQVSPPSAADVAQQRVFYEEAHRNWEQYHERNVQECVDSGEARAACESYDPEPTPADYALTASPFAEAGELAVLLGAFLAMLSAYLVSASSIGAEYASGALANWLTFVPQRMRVLASKLISVVAFSALVGAVVSFTMLGLAALLTRFYDGALTGVGGLAADAGRSVVLAAIAGVLGFVLALVSRHTVAAVGVVLAYLVVGSVLSGLTSNADGALAWLPPYLPENNVQAFLQHGMEYQQYREVPTPQGTTVEDVVGRISFAHSAVYWSIVVALAVGLAGLVFRRRDVT